MKNIYINQVSSFLPNKPVGNEEMENYIGLIGGKPSNGRKQTAAMSWYGRPNAQ